MTPEEDAALAGYAVEVPSGYYYSRTPRNILLRSALTDPALAAAAIDIAVFEAEDETYYSLHADAGRMLSPYTAHTPSGGGLAGKTLGTYLNRALAEPPRSLDAQGVIRGYSDREGLPRYPAEWLAAMNVREWRVHGTVGSYSFDHDVPAGTRRRYTPSMVEGDPYSTAPLSRSAFGFAFEYANDGHVVAVQFGFGAASTGRTAGVDTVYNSDPSSMLLLPRLGFSAQSPGGLTIAANSSADPSSFAAASEDGSATLFGYSLWSQESLAGGADYTLAIEAASLWSSSHLWRGE